MTHDQLKRNVFNRLALMEARPEMWASTREAFGLQLVTLVDMLLWPEEVPPRGDKPDLMKRLFGPGPIVLAEPIDAIWARQAVGRVRDFIERESSAQPPTSAEVVRYAATGQGRTAYDDLISTLGGPCQPEIVGWCDAEFGGVTRPALVITQAWPFLPLGTDPSPLIKAKKHVALIPDGDGFRFVVVPPPPSKETSPPPSKETSP